VVIDNPPTCTALLVCLSSDGSTQAHSILEDDGVWVTTCHDAEQAEQRIRGLKPDLVLVQVDGTKQEDWAACQRLTTSDGAAVLVLVRDAAPLSRVAAFACGADDVLAEPYEPLELTARVRALLRRSAARSAPPSVLRHQALELDLEVHEARLFGQPLPMTRLEFRLLRTLLEQPQRTFGREELLTRVHAFDDLLPSDRSIDLHVAELRAKLGDTTDAPRYIATVRGVGYRLARDGPTPSRTGGHAPMPSASPTLNYLDYDLSPEQTMIQTVVREFVEQEALPLVADHFEQGVFPTQLIPRLAELGILGPTIPEYGSGLDYMSYGLICQELDRADSGLRSFASVQGSLCMYPISAFGSDEQKQRYLPGMHAGTIIACFGLTEPDHGSDPSGMETRAVRDGATYVLNGTKMWITNGTLAQLAIIWAKVAEDGDDTIRGFLVPTDASGFTANPVHHKLSLRMSDTAELVLQDVRVPATAILPGVKGMRGPLACLNEARFGIVFGVVGSASACYESALRYSQVREQWGGPIAGFQLTQQKLVDALERITQAQLLAYQLGRLKDSHRLRPQQVSLGKRANVRMALEVAREMRSILGGNGISLEHPIFRHMVNLETVYTYEGTHEIHTLIVGADITGLAAFQSSATPVERRNGRAAASPALPR
jgi:glutaryl-CoA dehydrogenase